MRVLLAGKHELACRLFEYLNGSDFEVGVIVCQSEDRKRRESLLELVKKRNIFPLNKTYRWQELLSISRSFRPDLFISAGFDQILKRSLLAELSRTINVHFSLLPKYRGAYSIPWAIINSEKYIGVTVHEIDAGIDAGAIILQDKFLNRSGESCREIYLRACDMGVRLVRTYLNKLKALEKITKRPQNQKLATYFPLKFPDDFKINWHKSSNYIYNFVRASYFPPYAPAFSYLGARKVGFQFPIKFTPQKHNFEVGKIVEVDNQHRICADDGYIVPKKIRVNSSEYDFDFYVRKFQLGGRRFG